MIAARWMQFASRRRVPYDSQVEYLESTGTQWIDTGVYGTNQSIVILTVRLMELGLSVAVFGAFGGATESLYLYQAGEAAPTAYQVGFGNWANVGTKDTNTHTFRFADFSVSVDGSLLKTFEQQTFTTPHTLLLCNMHNQTGGVYSALRQRVYSCQIYNSTLVRDLIPVRKDGIGYMYDRVSATLFANAGSGAFTIGPDV